MSVLLFIAVLVVLIVVHELGHFLVAKWFGIRVDEFGVGYPPRAFVFGRWKGTTYTLNWLPFGGFVRIFGEHDDGSLTDEEKKEAFVHKHRGVQALVLVAGVIFNLVFAWMLFTATLMLGAPVQVSEAQATPEDTRLVVSSVVTGSPADTAGLMAGDEIVMIAAAAQESSLESLLPSTVSAFIQEHPGEALTITYIREPAATTTQTLTIIPAQGVLSDAPSAPAIGIAMALVAERSLGLFSALWQALLGTWNALHTVTVGLTSFFASAAIGSANWSDIAGPVGIAGLVGDASSVGFVYLLYFTAFISINLAVINLLPLPALDGGRLLFVAIESVIRRPIPPVIAGSLNVVGFTFIILLMLVVTYHDIVRLIG